MKQKAIKEGIQYHPVPSRHMLTDVHVHLQARVFPHPGTHTHIHARMYAHHIDTHTLEIKGSEHLV